MDQTTERPKRVGGLDISEVDDGFIVHQPERNRVHYLNHTTVVILELCTGRHTAAEITELVRRAYHLPEPPEKEVRETLARLSDEGLIQ
jgi:hypothetical protein